MTADAAQLEHELDRFCARRIANHGSSGQISSWIVSEIVGHGQAADCAEDFRTARLP
jgi:hypothetical protein